MVDIARRVYDHSWKFDPIIRSLLDLDFYKLSMGQLIWKHYPEVEVGFKVINRTKNIRLADIIPINEVIEQLDHVKTLHLQKSEEIYLYGNKFYEVVGIFEPGYINALKTLKLPDYHIEIIDGQYEITFTGKWWEVSLWEIYVLSILNELRIRKTLHDLGKFELDILYARAKTKLWEKLEKLANSKASGIADFSTRRRHGFLWQEWAVNAASSVLGSKFIGTSNVLVAMKHGYEAIGSNAHELPQTLAALSKTDEELLDSQYQVTRIWNTMYGGRLLVMLPDTFGTTQFLKNAPKFLDDWTGVRLDSKDPFKGGQEIIDHWKYRGQNPEEKLTLFSDGLDVDQIIALSEKFYGQTRLGFGWGTLFGNDFRGCHPRNLPGLEPISIVCKVYEANGNPACKLSDNYEKATGLPDVIARYRKVFGTEGVTNIPVIV